MDRVTSAVDTTVTSNDAAEFPGGRPLIVMRDVEIDGCSRPCTETDGDCQTSDSFDEDSAILYKTRESTTVGYVCSLSSLVRRVPATGLFSLPLCDGCPLR
eukprot:740879-Pyramimonas_sp.AAC.1